jgi:hypothetical protein
MSAQQAEQQSLLHLRAGRKLDKDDVALERAVSKVERIIDTGYRVIRLPAVLASCYFLVPCQELNFWPF